jgi:hypothetical protein
LNEERPGVAAGAFVCVDGFWGALRERRSGRRAKLDEKNADRKNVRAPRHVRGAYHAGPLAVKGRPGAGTTAPEQRNRAG